jgi:hypothetical protein
VFQMPASKDSDVVDRAHRLWLTLPHEDRTTRKLAAPTATPTAHASPEPVARFLALTLSKYERGRSLAAAGQVGLRVPP